MIALRQQRIDEAADHLKRWNRLLPLDPSSAKALAGVYLARGQSSLAIDSLRALAAVEEEDPEIPAYLARFLVVDGRLAEGRGPDDDMYALLKGIELPVHGLSAVNRHHS